MLKVSSCPTVLWVGDLGQAPQVIFWLRVRFNWLMVSLEYGTGCPLICRHTVGAGRAPTRLFLLCVPSHVISSREVRALRRLRRSCQPPQSQAGGSEHTPFVGTATGLQRKSGTWVALLPPPASLDLSWRDLCPSKAGAWYRSWSLAWFGISNLPTLTSATEKPQLGHCLVETRVLQG